MNKILRATVFISAIVALSSSVFLLSCSRNFGSSKNSVNLDQHASSTKWVKFAQYVGIPVDSLSPESYASHYYKNLYSQLPQSAKRTVYHLDSENNPLTSKENFWYKNTKTNEFTQNPHPALTLWTRNAQILENVTKANNAKRWQSQCGGIVGIAPYVSDTHNLLNDQGKSLVQFGKPGENNSQTVYLLKYLVRNTDSSVDTEPQVALVSIPNQTSQFNQNMGFGDKFPLLLYAHAGDSGLSYDEISKILTNHLNRFVVVAPTYPGEPLCSYQSKHGKRYCRNEQGDKVNPVLPITGKRSALDTEAFHILALQNCVAHFLASEDATVNLLDRNYNVTNTKIKSPLSGKMLYNYSKNDYLEKSLASVSNKNENEIAEQLRKVAGISTILVGASRGGGVILVTLARAGMLIQNWSETATTTDLINPSYFPNFISSAALFFPPSSMLTGPFRYLTEIMLRGVMSDKFDQLPMIPELRALFKEYQLAPSDSQKELEALERLTAEIAVRDTTYMAPYLGVALQNWRSFWNSAYPKVINFELTGGLVARSNKGAISIYHGTEDRVVPFDQSIIAAYTFNAVNSYAKNTSELFFKNNIPGFSHAVFAFQPLDGFYTNPYSMNSKTCGPKKFTEQVNKHTNSCYTEEEDLRCHGDVSFATAGLVNILTPAVYNQASSPITGPDYSESSKVPGKISFDPLDIEKGSPRFTYEDIIDDVYEQFKNFSYQKIYETKNYKIPRPPMIHNLRLALAYLTSSSEPSTNKTDDFDGTSPDDPWENDYILRSKRYSFTISDGLTTIYPYGGNWSSSVEKTITPSVMFTLWMETAVPATILDQNYNACFGANRCQIVQ
ncbi:MAG: hypothetical protein K2X39_06585 [Silvanigrellaceae bacterium]|nr:hypothetical protein [Silvanigrellaceae bacterium]